ncbi:lysozyme inhibitor LprI family protein [Pseudoruegeria sp. HB172150]|uniref:lysozyme inhibitor LprI family protein n=1 Tax=Pseudoruegeria sp. HB172150 TaxID=2721164 RepID=UPI001557CF29|nr:lysozyme inhibitor LprI family protein [Pseudoruegeria sp. HB172150]
MRRLVLLTALSLPAQAPAQELPFDRARIESCLAASATQDEKLGCIGLGSESCRAGSAGGTTIGIVECTALERDFWDARLNATYRALRSHERAQDAEVAGLPYAQSQVDALQEMQRAWIGFRDTTCRYESAQYAGTLSRPVHIHCLMRLTAE